MRPRPSPAAAEWGQRVREQLRTRGEIALLLGVSVATVSRWMKTAGLPATREGRSGRIIARRDIVLRWHARYCRNPQLYRN